MTVQLPGGKQTNGTWLATQMTHNLIRGMITWHNTWGPRYVAISRICIPNCSRMHPHLLCIFSRACVRSYGVLPGYGIAMQNGFEDVFTATVMAALEVGAMTYARGLVDHPQAWHTFSLIPSDQSLSSRSFSWITTGATMSVTTA